MSDDAPPRINNPSSHGSLLARELVNAAKSDAPAPSAKAAARAKFEQFLASESQPKPKAPATDMPLFGASPVDVLEAAAQHTIPAHENKPTNSSVVEKAAVPSSNGDFFAASAAPAITANSAAKSEQHPTGERHENSVLFSLAKLSGAPDNKAMEEDAKNVDKIVLSDVRRIAELEIFRNSNEFYKRQEKSLLESGVSNIPNRKVNNYGTLLFEVSQMGLRDEDLLTLETIRVANEDWLVDEKFLVNPNIPSHDSYRTKAMLSQIKKVSAKFGIDKPKLRGKYDQTNIFQELDKKD